MIIQLKKFGETLTSRPGGKEAYASFLPSLHDLSADEMIEVSFDGIGSLSPSWADEFLTPLQARFGDRLQLHSTENASVKITVPLLEEVNHIVFQKITS